MMLKNFDEMEQFVLAQPAPRKVALAAAHDADALGSLLMAVDKGVPRRCSSARRTRSAPC